MQIGALTMLEPLVLFGLLALPVIWWVLRITPPRPIEQVFPPLRLLLGVPQDEEVPKSTPPWLLFYRLVMVTLLAFALAKPILFRQTQGENRPLILIIDNGWGSAGNWTSIEREATAITKHAISNNLDIAIVPTLSNREDIKFVPATQALNTLNSLSPLPFTANRGAVEKRLQGLALDGANVIWLTDNLEYGSGASLGTTLQAATSTSLYQADPENAPVIAGSINETADGFRVEWKRVGTSSPRNLTAIALGARGQVLGRETFRFSAGMDMTEATFSMPSELRNQVAQIRLDGYASAATTILLDDSWGRPLIGLLKGSDENVQPLLSDWHYIEKALSPSADIFRGDLDELVDVSPSIIFMSDRARTINESLEQYVEDGGMLVRFAGDNLAKRVDALIPVPLRFGGRQIGGALAWETPKGLAAFSAESPFFGLSVNEDVHINKQVMAQPGASTDNHTWARLKDGSPLITSSSKGLGRIVLFHVTAGPDWSDLPLSGLYVDMLKRILPLARPGAITNDPNAQGDFTPERTVNGYGQLGTPPLNALPIPNTDFASTFPSFSHPPGLYRQGTRRMALNTVPNNFQLKSLKISGASTHLYGAKTERSLAGVLLMIVIIMLAIDVLLSLLASGRLNFRRVRSQTLAGLLIAGFALFPTDIHAQSLEHQDALELRFAYIITGDNQIDDMSKSGLVGLISELSRRTTIEPAGARGLNLDTDTLDYYPFIYWPVLRTQSELSDAVADKINQYMAAGGTLLLDTQDTGRQKLLGNETHPGLATLSRKLDIPRLSHPSNDHVITKSFYLLRQFPGRYADGKIWVQSDTRGTARDGVSSVILGGNDWTSAWAKDEKGRGITVLENDIPRQREMAYRFGVNVAMYTLSGNYKSDQVHAAVLVKRVGEQFGADEETDKPSTPNDKDKQ